MPSVSATVHNRRGVAFRDRLISINFDGTRRMTVEDIRRLADDLSALAQHVARPMSYDVPKSERLTVHYEDARSRRVRLACDDV